MTQTGPLAAEAVRKLAALTGSSYMFNLCQLGRVRLCAGIDQSLDNFRLVKQDGGQALSEK